MIVGNGQQRSPHGRNDVPHGFHPFSECWEFFSSFACWGPWSGRSFYARKERIEALEKLKKRLQAEITAIDEMIQDLKSREAKQT